MVDHTLPFQIETTGLRGRLVRLGPLLTTVLNRHAYPTPVARLLGETLALTAALAATLKYEGVFTLQAKGNGPVKMLVADVASTPGDAVRALRGYARFDPAAKIVTLAGSSLPALLGEGYLAFTVDQGEDCERYQGIVALTGDTLAASVQHYFLQSEQLPTSLSLAVDCRDDEWRATALLLQRLPESAGTSGAEDDWHQALALINTLKTEEMLDPAITDEALLYRLFHQDGVRVFAASPLRAGCRCSRSRVATTLHALGQAEVLSLRGEDGLVTVTCEFCNASYGFDRVQLEGLWIST